MILHVDSNNKAEQHRDRLLHTENKLPAARGDRGWENKVQESKRHKLQVTK